MRRRLEADTTAYKLVFWVTAWHLDVLLDDIFMPYRVKPLCLCSLRPRSLVGVFLEIERRLDPKRCLEIGAGVLSLASLCLLLPPHLVNDLVRRLYSFPLACSLVSLDVVVHATFVVFLALWGVEMGLPSLVRVF